MDDLEELLLQATLGGADGVLRSEAGQVRGDGGGLQVAGHDRILGGREKGGDYGVLGEGHGGGHLTRWEVTELEAGTWKKDRLFCTEMKLYFTFTFTFH